MFKFIGAFIAAVTLIKEIWEFFRKLVGDDPKKFVKDLNETFAKLNKAETKEERLNAAREIQDLIRKL